MFSFQKAAALMLLVVCSLPAGANSPEPKELDTSVMLLNFPRPLMSVTLAEKLTRSFLEEKYPANIFEITGPARIVDEGDLWYVSFENALYVSTEESMKSIIPKAIGLEICKANGQIWRLR